MIEIAGKPIIGRNIELLRRAGIVDVFVNLHYHPEPVIRYLGDGSAFGVNVSYVYEPTLLGTAGAVRNMSNVLRGGDFVVVYGDNLSSIHLGRLNEFHQTKQGVMTMALYHRDDIHESGAAEIEENDRIVRFLEKPDDDFSHWVNAGYYVCAPGVLDAIPEAVPSDFGLDVIPAMLAAGAKIYGYRMTEKLWWIDTPADYQRTVQEFSGGAPD